MASIAGIGSMMDLESFSQEPKSDGMSYATFSLSVEIPLLLGGQVQCQ